MTKTIFVTEYQKSIIDKQIKEVKQDKGFTIAKVHKDLINFILTNDIINKLYEVEK